MSFDPATGKYIPYNDDDDDDQHTSSSTTNELPGRGLINISRLGSGPLGRGQFRGGSKSRRRSYRKSRKVRKSKVQVSKYRKHRHYRRSRRH
jgi:hypothetical protein